MIGKIYSQVKAITEDEAEALSAMPTYRMIHADRGKEFYYNNEKNIVMIIEVEDD